MVLPYYPTTSLVDVADGQVDGRGNMENLHDRSKRPSNRKIRPRCCPRCFFGQSLVDVDLSRMVVVEKKVPVLCVPSAFL
jgi:hypothetical protein